MDQDWRRASQATLEALKKFAYTAWNDPNTLRDRSTSPSYEYLVLGEHLAGLRDLCGGLFKRDKILVRQEYRDILKAFDENLWYQDGAYVTGQPGIGKTYFLVYLLIERLREKKPVAFQPLHGQPFYALFKDTVAFHPFNDPTPLSHVNDVWALTDSTLKVPTPDLVFQRAGIRIIQTTSPRAYRWKEWSKQYGARWCVMNIWSEKEIADLASLLGLNVKTMSALAAKWGGVPRTLLSFYNMSKEAIEWEILTAASSAVSAITSSLTFLLSLGQLDAPESGASLIFFVLPTKDRAGHLDRSFPPRACIPAPALVNALGNIRKNLLSKLHEIVCNFLNCIEFRGIEDVSGAGYSYEYSRTTGVELLTSGHNKKST